MKYGYIGIWDTNDQIYCIECPESDTRKQSIEILKYMPREEIKSYFTLGITKYKVLIQFKRHLKYRKMDV